MRTSQFVPVCVTLRFVIFATLFFLCLVLVYIRFRFFLLIGCLVASLDVALFSTKTHNCIHHKNTYLHTPVFRSQIMTLRPLLLFPFVLLLAPTSTDVTRCAAMFDLLLRNTHTYLASRFACSFLCLISLIL